MVVSPDVARARFARVVRRALDDARSRGLTDREIAKMTGVGSSTFHRWRNGEGAGLPKVERVIAFFEALEIPAQAALAALGVERQRPEPVDADALPPAVQRIMRKLRDPRTSAAERQAILHTLTALAGPNSHADPEPDLRQ
jgi:transcriptional regulator with XRE-family HTH domain